MQAKRLGLMLLIAGLAGCRLLPGADAPPPSAGATAPPSRLVVSDGAVAIAGPRGFCVDEAASTTRATGAALVVLSPCRALGAGLFGPRATHPALLTAAVAAPARGTLQPVAAPALADFAASRAGRAALSRAGKPDTVQILEMLTGADTFLLRLSDTAPFAWGTVQPEYWRGVLSAGGRTVTISVLALPDTPLSRDQGLALLTEFVVSLRAATAELPQNAED